MDKNLETEYKLTLGYDLITFILNIHNDGLSKEQKDRRTNMILQAWEKRIDANLKIISNKNIEELTELTTDDSDVLRILHNIHAMQADTIRKEFKHQIQGFVSKSYNNLVK